MLKTLLRSPDKEDLDKRAQVATPSGGAYHPPTRKIACQPAVVCLCRTCTDCLATFSLTICIIAAFQLQYDEVERCQTKQFVPQAPAHSLHVHPSNCNLQLPCPLRISRACRTTLGQWHAIALTAHGNFCLTRVTLLLSRRSQRCSLFQLCTNQQSSTLRRCCSMGPGFQSHDFHACRP